MNQLAKAIVDISVGEALREVDPDEGKNAAAVALGRLGGAWGSATQNPRVGHAVFGKFLLPLAVA